MLGKLYVCYVHMHVRVLARGQFQMTISDDIPPKLFCFNFKTYLSFPSLELAK